jgi:hypothetical protein
LRHTYWKHDDQQGPLEIELQKTSTSNESRAESPR